MMKENVIRVLGILHSMYMKNRARHLLYVIPLILCSCASSFPVHFLCNEKHVEIYIDDQHIGRGQVSYTVPKGTETIRVSCRDNGIEIYSREYYVKDRKTQLIEITIPMNYRYSNNKH